MFIYGNPTPGLGCNGIVIYDRNEFCPGYNEGVHNEDDENFVSKQWILSDNTIWRGCVAIEDGLFEVRGEKSKGLMLRYICLDRSGTQHLVKEITSYTTRITT